MVCDGHSWGSQGTGVVVASDELPAANGMGMADNVDWIFVFKEQSRGNISAVVGDCWISSESCVVANVCLSSIELRALSIRGLMVILWVVHTRGMVASALVTGW